MVTRGRSRRHGPAASQSGVWGGVERGRAEGKARWDCVAPQFLSGESALEPEIILTPVTEEMADAAFIERGQVGLVDRPNSHPMDLRVTAVFRREVDGRKAVHRHGGYLVMKQR
jgi:hypothetical protein